MMATLYDVGLPTINEHIKKIYADSELEEAATIRNFRIVQTEGSRQVTRDTKHYSLQMIIAVGLSMADLELLSIGLINDMYAESRNDDCKYAELATQEDFDRF